MTAWLSSPLRTEHETASFRCGHDSLDAWLLTQALRAQSSGTARPYVWTGRDDTVVKAYFAIAPTQVSRAEVSRSMAGGVSVVPAYLLAKLALDQSLQDLFAGYGEKDFFPSLYCVTFSGSVAGVIRRFDESRTTISADNLVTITPLGLTDAIHSFLRGLSPQYRNAAHDNLEAFHGAVMAAGVDAEQIAKAASDAHEQLDSAFETSSGTTS